MVKAVGVPAPAVAHMRQGPGWAGLESVANTLAYDATIVGDGALPVDRAALVTVPTLVLDGGASPAWARNAVQALVEALPNGRRVTLEGQTHNVSPDALVPALDEFFSS